MGMFDYLTINPQLLPLSPEEGEYIKHFNFQTKDLDNTLSIVEITDEGELFYKPVNYEWENTRKELPAEKRIYTGTIEFHDVIGSKWISFIATFVEGKMIRVERTK